METWTPILLNAMNFRSYTLKSLWKKKKKHKHPLALAFKLSVHWIRPGLAVSHDMLTFKPQIIKHVWVVITLHERKFRRSTLKRSAVDCTTLKRGLKPWDRWLTENDLQEEKPVDICHLSSKIEPNVRLEAEKTSVTFPSASLKSTLVT